MKTQEESEDPVQNQRRALGVSALALFFAAGLVVAQVAVGKPPARSEGSGKGTVTTTSSSTSTSTTTSTTTPPPTTTTKTLTGSFTLVDRKWKCTSAVNVDSVTVTMTGAVDDDAVLLGDGCTGYIGRITVVTYARDGIKVGGKAHDLTVGGGSVRCYAKIGSVHQDGVQVMGATNILFRNLDDRCYTSNNSDFFVTTTTAASGGLPASNVICDGCFFGASTTDPRTGKATLGPASTVNIGDTAVASGVRNSTVCPGKYFTLRLQSPSSVNYNSTLLTSCVGP
jgi:hypothetical protein